MVANYLYGVLYNQNCITNRAKKSTIVAPVPALSTPDELAAALRRQQGHVPKGSGLVE
jgi:hypothetical protein